MIKNLMFFEKEIPNFDSTQIFVAIIGIILSSILAFVGFFFILLNIWKFLFSFKNINYFKKIFFTLILGLLFSLIAPMIAQIGLWFDVSSYSMITQVLVITLFSFFVSTFCMIGSFPIFLITNIFIFHVTIYELLFLILFYGLSVIYVFFNRFLFLQKMKFIMITTILLFIIVFLIYLIFFNTNNIETFSFNIIINFILFLILYAISLYLFNFINSAYKLKTSIFYDSDYFVNSGYSKQGFEEYIKKNNIQTGLLLTFDILNLDNILLKEGKTASDNVEKTFIKYIFHSLGKNCFYFKTNKNKYAVFLNVDKSLINLKCSIENNKLPLRTKNDFLKKYEEILNKFPQVVDFNKNKYSIQIIAFCSIYGIQSNNFYNLIKYNLKTKEQWSINKDVNSIKLYEYKEKEIVNMDKPNYISINNKYNLDNIVLSLVEFEIFDLKKKKKIICYAPKIRWLQENIYSFDMLKNKFYDDELAYSIILRNISYRCLILYNKLKSFEKDSNIRLLLFYPLSKFDDKHFDIITFMQKVNKFDIFAEDVILAFDFEEINKINNVIKNNIFDLQVNGFNICFYGYNKTKSYLKNNSKEIIFNYII